MHIFDTVSVSGTPMTVNWENVLLVAQDPDRNDRSVIHFVGGDEHRLGVSRKDVMLAVAKGMKL